MFSERRIVVIDSKSFSFKDAKMASTLFGCAIIAVIFGNNVIVSCVPVNSTTILSVNTTQSAENGTHQEFGSSTIVSGVPVSLKTRTVSRNATNPVNGTEFGSSKTVSDSGSIVSGLPVNSTTSHTTVSVNTSNSAETGLPVNSTTTTVSVNTTKTAENGTHQEL